jgi:hypothetical protein
VAGFFSVPQIRFHRRVASVVRGCLELELIGKSTRQRCRVEVGVRMLIMLTVIYLGGWLAVTCAAYAAGRRLTDSEAPPVHPLVVGLAAGAVWPLLVVGLVELSSIMVFTKVQPKPASNVGILV